MLRTSWTARGATLLCALVACSEGTPTTKRTPAPGEGVLPSAGKTSAPDETPPDDAGGAGGDSSVASGGAGGASELEPDPDPGVGTELRVSVSADGSTYVDLNRGREVDGDGDWDLVFRGWDIFTNGGASGSGMGAAFGPLPFTYFLAAEEPAELPFLIEDKPAGAFRDWYFYDGKSHALYSRFHVYGGKTASRLFKLQVLGYYGDVQGAPISALYRLRYAELSEDGASEVVEVTNLDATAGGLGGEDDSPSGCLSLRTGERPQLAPSAQSASLLWDLGFRRDSISVNGGLGGPSDVAAVDLRADETEGETLEDVKARSADSEAAAFADVDYATLASPSLKYRGDRIVSAFTDAWAKLEAEPPTLADDNTWLVAGGDGQSRFLIGITGVSVATQAAPGTVVLRYLKLR